MIPVDFIQQLTDEVDTHFTRKWINNFSSIQFRQFIYLGSQLPKMSESLKSRYWAELDSIFKSVSIYKSMVVSDSLYGILTEECPEGFRGELNKRVWPSNPINRVEAQVIR